MYYSLFTATLLMAILIEWTCYHVLRKKINIRTHLLWRTMYWIVTCLGIAALMYLLLQYRQQSPSSKILRIYVVPLYLLLLATKLIFLCYVLLQWCYQQVIRCYKKTSAHQYSPDRRNFITQTGIILAATPLTTSVFSILRPFKTEQVEKNLFFSSLPEAFDGYKIVHISDLHLGSFISKDPVMMLADQINTLSADLVVFTGDLINEIAEEAIEYVNILRQITTPTIAILGNHDYGDYFYPKEDREGKQKNMRVLTSIYQQLGWNLLRNESIYLHRKNQFIILTGCENWGYSARFQKYGDIHKSIQGLDIQNNFSILLTHDPSHFEYVIEKEKIPFDLTLCGHTHGMQMGIRTVSWSWSPAASLYKYWGGLYENQYHQKIYVNTGYGYIGIPGRLGILPEITLLTLRKE